jgi:signal transduction histidine kinase
MVLLMGLALLIAQLANFAFILSGQQRLSLAQSEGPAITRFVQVAAQASLGSDAPSRLPSVARGHGASFSLDGESIVDRAGLPRESDIEARLQAALAEAGINARQVRAATSFDIGRFRPGLDDHRGGRRAPPERQVLLLAAQLPDGIWLNGRLEAPRRDPWLLWRLIGSTVALYALVLGAMLWIAWRIARPVRDLTRAAEQFEGRRAPEPVEPRGPGDLRKAIEAFNDMNRRVSALLDEKDRMLGAIGHDLRTPLASIRIRAEAMEPADERARLVATVEEMSATLEDILVLARTGRAREESRPMDVGALADALVEDYRERGTEVVFEGGDEAVAEVQPNLLRRAIRNLIDNALAYGTHARVRTRAEGASVVIEVEDDGPGIAEDRMDMVVQSFTRLESSRNRNTGGIGLGLAIVESVARAHAGELRLRNGPRGLIASLVIARREAGVRPSSSTSST